ncbi:hypothetical protein S40285_06641 [Stachybotrys chlorohalonatus IBT 40285]|uniref:Oxysterol-binding protein n=1 Tax=Stachybotrys chlorohalonatus (strain IBT 40285) TaxID=1283841 RepID=A0A084QWE4_STAC4|nr:hypothetical protein S40285_06641 [Stachybotrys chlorohalonata IBT 40285]
MTHMTSHLSQLKDFLAYLATVKGDVSNVTAPPFVLAPKSAIEIPAAWASCHALFLQPASEPDPAVRALLVAKNYLCSLRQLVGEGSRDAAKKPLNPFLGELFLGEFVGDEGVTRLVAEQVSHHPPVTAVSMYNPAHGISSTGFVAQETTFSPMSGVTVKQPGYAVVTDAKHNEQHLMTMPILNVRGIALGQPYPELEGPCYISSSSGYVTKIDFNGKGRLSLSGKNRVAAELYHESDPKTILYEIKGQWNGHISIKDAKGDFVEEFMVDSIPRTPLRVPPIDAQSPSESRRAWSKVVDGIRKADVEMVASCKNTIEEKQRELRKLEQQEGREWQTVFFRWQEGDEEARYMLRQIPDELWRGFDIKRTAGAWKFVGVDKAEALIDNLHPQPN